MIYINPQGEIKDDDQVEKHYGWWQMLKDFIRILLYTVRGGK